MIRTAVDLLAALAKNPDADLEINADVEISIKISVGRPILRLLGNTVLRIEARESSSPRIVARESSSPRIEAFGSSSPRIEARESSSPRIEARESSSPSIEAFGSSSPRIEAMGFAQIRLRGLGIKAKATANVSVLLHKQAKCSGGKQTRVEIKTAKDWCEYYGVTVKRGIATLYKALNDDFTSPHGISYAPGTTPVAPDWDGGKQECGFGLHFSPSPAMAREFHEPAKRYAACQVRLTDIVVHPDGEYPQKVKASQCCTPCVEVDRDGGPV